MPIQWLRNNIGSLLHSAISATAVSGLVVKEIAKFSIVMITIANTDIETDSELDDQIAQVVGSSRSGSTPARLSPA